MHQDLSKENVKVIWQQQASIDTMKTGFDNAERKADTINIDVKNLHVKMDRVMSTVHTQGRKLEELEKSMVEFHQKCNHNIKWNIKAIERQDNVSIYKMEQELKNLVGDMEELKTHVLLLLSKIDPMCVGGVREARAES